ncbi:MAG: purine-nucleoside phosphorylase [Desulfovibrio sp.]|nr:purine-nucleoside phosphorylase [Desulfovibrio sp.]
MQNFQDVQRAAEALHGLLQKGAPSAFLCGTDGAGQPPLGIVLGTGLSFLADSIADSVTVPYAAIPGFPVSSVEGHVGAFVWGHMPRQCGESDEPGRTVIVQQGRCHLYEGRSPAEVCMGVRVMAAMGVRTLVITNASGALNPLFDVPGLMCMTDIINQTGVSPLTGANCDVWGPRFPDMSAPLDARLRTLAMETAARLGLRLERGVYIGVHGPEMETPAETRMYRQWGADAVGMSSVLEIIAARHLGMAVLGLSCLTNRNLPDCMAPTSLEQICDVAQKAGKNLARLIRALVTKL